MIVYEKSFRLGGIGNIKRRERNIEFESCFFLFISRRAFAEEMEKIFLRANFSSDTKFRRRVYLFFSLSLYFEGEGKKCFQERFSIPQTSPRFSNFLPLVFPSISTSPPPLLANPFPFLPVLQYRAVYRATRSFYDAIYSRKWSSDGVTP